MIGPLINGAAIVVGSVVGAFIGAKIKENVKQNMPMVFGIASMGLGLRWLVRWWPWLRWCLH